MANKMFHPDLVKLNLKVETDKEALSFCADILREKGYVKETFKDGLMAREVKYPTGIAMPFCGVAIPHCDSIHVNKPAIMFVSLENPVLFNSMEDANETVEVSFMLCLAVEHEEDQVKLLPKIMKLFLKEESIETLRKSNSAEGIIRFLEKNVSL